MDYMLQFLKKGGNSYYYFSVFYYSFFFRNRQSEKKAFSQLFHFDGTLFAHCFRLGTRNRHSLTYFLPLLLFQENYTCLTQLFTVNRVKFKKYHQNGMKIHFRCNFYDNIPRESLFYQRKYFWCFFHTLATKRVCCKVATILFYAFGP